VPEVVKTNCERCHGVDGLATQPGMPHLNGQLDSYLKDALLKYQKGRLPTAVVDHVPPSFGEVEVAAISSYYAGIKAVRPRQETDPAKVASGEVVYRNRCADCHPDNGREADKDAPLMAAQNLGYMIEQTGLFLNGKRKFGFLQDEAFQGLSIDELESAAHFFASQEQFLAKSGKKRRR